MLTGRLVVAKKGNHFYWPGVGKKKKKKNYTPLPSLLVFYSVLGPASHLLKYFSSLLTCLTDGHDTLFPCLFPLAFKNSESSCHI